MSVTHIAGHLVTVGARKIQRCGVCGEKLADNIEFLRGLVSSPDGAPVFSYWAPGALVQVDGHRSSVLDHVDGTDLPDDACISLVEE